MAAIWITRTEPGASRLAKALTEAGHSPYIAPVLTIEPIDPPRVLINNQPNSDFAQISGLAPSLVIAVSGHAVEQANRQGLLEQLETQPALAVGQQTALDLQKLGIACAVPKQTDSEGLLAMPQIKALSSGDRVWILAGVGGRSVLAEQLQHRFGATVVKFELYQRREVASLGLDTQAIAVVIVQSVEGVAACWHIWSDNQGSDQVQVIVPSARVAAAAGDLGFKQVHVAEDASVRGCLAALDATGFGAS